MSYQPFAYVMQNDGKWWIVLRCPSGLSATLRNQYATKPGAEAGVAALGFTLTNPPRREDLP